MTLLKNRFKKMTIIFITIISLVAIIILCLPLLGPTLVNHFTFFPTEGIDIDPKSIDAPVESLMLKAEDGVKVSAFYLPNKEAKKTVLIFHGNQGNASSRLPLAYNFWKLKYSVLLMDYRGYGLSEGKSSEKGIYLDSYAGLHFLTKTKKTKIEDIIIFGRSLGSAVSVNLAQHKPFAAVILVSPLSSGLDAANKMGLSWLGYVVGNPLPSIERIKNVKSPLLIFHGDKDDQLPIEMGKKLFEKANEPKLFIAVKDAGHDGLIEHEKAFFSIVDAFIEKH